MKYSCLAYFDKDLEKFNPPMFFPHSVDDAVERLKVLNPLTFMS